MEVKIGVQNANRELVIDSDQDGDDVEKQIREGRPVFQAKSLADGATEFSAKLYAVTYAGGAAYDSDGNGAEAAVLFAQVAAGTALSELDFVAYTPVI